MSAEPEIAYYYPSPYWMGHDNSWVKSLLLFFDQIAILLPRYMYGRHAAADPATVLPLEESGVLRVLDPDDWIDQETAESLAEMMVDLLTGEVFDDLPKDVPYHALSRSRMAYGADVGLADMLVEELLARDLALPVGDREYIQLHPAVRTTILVLLAQLSRPAGARKGLVVHPTTNMSEAIEDLIRTLSQKPMPSANRVIKLDLEPVSFDLSEVPLDEILDFRAEHRSAYRAYVDGLYGFMAELAEVDEFDEREQLMLGRRQEIAEAARELRRSRFPWRRENLASFAFGIAGAAWTLGHGDLVGAVLGAGKSVADKLSGKHTKVSAYSYIFDIGKQFGDSRAS